MIFFLILSSILTVLFGNSSGLFGIYRIIDGFFVYPSIELFMIETYIEWPLKVNLDMPGYWWLSIFMLLDYLIIYLLSKKIATSTFAFKLRYAHFLLTLPLVIIWWFIPNGDPNVIWEASKKYGSFWLYIGAIWLAESYLSLFYTGWLLKKISAQPCKITH